TLVLDRVERICTSALRPGPGSQNHCAARGAEAHAYVGGTRRYGRMRVIIMGCGRVGEQVSRLLADEGHAVMVIDYDASALERLGPAFKGRTIKGVGFDRKILLAAGIE